MHLRSRFQFYSLRNFVGLFSCLLTLSACVSTALEVDNRGNQPIPTSALSAMKKKGMEPTDPVLVRIFKMESELELWKRDKSGRFALLNTYPMCRWSGQLGPKKREGDRQAPEGFYKVNAARLNPKSKFHLSFDLGYPNKLEKSLGYTGSALMVHGACSSSGCFAISDEYVSEVYAIVREALRAGQPSFQVQSYPFRMTIQNMSSHRNNTNFSFWLDLKGGYDRFEVNRLPPKFHFCEGRYRFGKPQKQNDYPSDPLLVCPKYNPVEPAIAAFGVKDSQQNHSTVELQSASILAYADGGMNPEYRRVLKERGADYLSRVTSLTLVPVSRPRAALKDPYKFRKREREAESLPK